MIHAVIQILINDSGVQAAIGQNKGEEAYKIYPVFADQDEEPPFTVASIIGNSPNYCKDGSSRLDTVSFRLISYSREYEELDDIDNAIRFALDGFRGTSESIPLSIWFENHVDAPVEGKDYMARVSDYKAHVSRTA